MMKSEFIERTGFEPTASEYEEIEQEYMGCDEEKDQFCKKWKRNGGIQRLSRLRVRKIEELERKLATAESQYSKRESQYNDLNDLYLKVKDERDTAVAKLVSIKNFL